MITYYPYKNQKKFIPFLFAADVILTALTILDIYNSNTSSLLILAIPFLLVNVSIFLLVRTCKISITIDCDVIYVQQYKGISKAIHINQFCYFYHAKDFRNHNYWVLASNFLTQKTANQIAMRCSFLNSPFYEETICIYIDPLQDASTLKEYITSNLSTENCILYEMR